MDRPDDVLAFSGPQQYRRIDYYAVRSPEDAIVGDGVVIVDVTAAERSRREQAEAEAAAAQREHALGRHQGLVAATSSAVWIRGADGGPGAGAPDPRAITGQSSVGRASSTPCTPRTGTVPPATGGPRPPRNRPRRSPTRAGGAPRSTATAGSGPAPSRAVAVLLSATCGDRPAYPADDLAVPALRVQS